MKIAIDNVSLVKAKGGSYLNPYIEKLEDPEHAVLGYYRTSGCDGIMTFSIIKDYISSFVSYKNIGKTDAASFVERLNNKDKDTLKRDCIRSYVREFKRRLGFDPDYKQLERVVDHMIGSKAFNELVLEVMLYVKSVTTRDGNKYDVDIEGARSHGFPEIIILEQDKLYFVKVKQVWKQKRSLEKFHSIVENVFSKSNVAVKIANIKKIKGEDGFLDHIKRREVELKRVQLTNADPDDRAWWVSLNDSTLVSVEMAALGVYENEGWHGVWAENKLFYILVTSIAHALGYTFREFYLRASPPQERLLTANEIGHVSSESLIKSFNELKNGATEIDYTYPIVEYGISHADILAMYDGLGPENIAYLIETYQQRGWPDLFLYRDGQVKFVEVKSQTDSVRTEQEQLVINILLPSMIDFELIEVKQSTDC